MHYDIATNLDYAKLIDYHNEKNRVCSIVALSKKNDEKGYKNFGCFVKDAETDGNHYFIIKRTNSSCRETRINKLNEYSY